MTPVLGPAGALPVVVPLFGFVAARLGALAFRGMPEATVADRAVAGVTLGFAVTIAAVRALSCARLVSTGPLLAALVLATCALAFVGRDARFVCPARAVLRSPDVIAALVLATAALALAVAAATLLPVWQWDALGYHLPFVHFTLAGRSVDAVPSELDYIGTYPHDVELFVVALRACLPDDRLVDLGQVPFGVGGAVVTAALARRLSGGAPGASRLALVAGASWLALPAVFLQLPTDYVDVATATFVLAALYFASSTPSPAGTLLGGLAAGLVAGSKPSGPLPAALLLAIVLVRAVRHRHTGAACVAVVLALAFGAGSYVDNLLRHGNPLWPVALHLGPLDLEGPQKLGELLASGPQAPHLSGPLPLRMLRSLLAVDAPPAFDMRFGGFGLVTLVALPLACVGLVRRGSLPLSLACLATLLSPDPSVARYVLALPAIVLACAASSLAAVRPSRQRVGALLALALGLVGLVRAAPGLTGEGPQLSTYLGMTEAERALAVGADGRPVAVVTARSLVAPGESFAFDVAMDLSDLAFDPAPERTERGVFFLASSLVGDRVGDAVARHRVRVMVVGDDTPAGAWAASHPEVVTRLEGRPSCRAGACGMFLVR